MNDQPLHKAGFTLIEMLLVIMIFGIIGTITLNFFATLQPKLELRGAAREAQFLIHRARMEAIRRGVSTVVQADLQTGSLVAYADVNGDPVTGNPGHAKYLRYDPDPAIGNKKTDYEIGQIHLGSSSFGAPPSYQIIEGFTDVPGESVDVPAVLVFSPLGSIEATGALRFSDGSGRNHIEAAVTSRAGKVEVRKFLKADDSPTSSAGFFQEGAGGDGANVWVWY